MIIEKKALNTAIRSIKNRADTITSDIQLAVQGGIYHAIAFGDAVYLNSLLRAVGKGIKADRLKQFIAGHAPVTASNKGTDDALMIVKGTGKGMTLDQRQADATEAAESLPSWVEWVKEAKEVTHTYYDFRKALSTLTDNLNKKTVSPEQLVLVDRFKAAIDNILNPAVQVEDPIAAAVLEVQAKPVRTVGVKTRAPKEIAAPVVQAEPAELLAA